ncbi:MAG: hypothetical protein JWM27_301 [Gemmatimonadetes bacterium]|nr:hypothetical protein [Gemmatimonadota bacterium]
MSAFVPRRLLQGATILLATACAPAATARRSGPPPDTHVMSADQIAASGARTAWEVLRHSGRLHLSETADGRPTGVLSDHGRSSLYLDDAPLILVDGIRIIDISILYTMRAEQIERVRFLNGTDGTIAHGTGAGSGVVEIETRDPSRA